MAAEYDQRSCPWLTIQYKYMVTGAAGQLPLQVHPRARPPLHASESPPRHRTLRELTTLHPPLSRPTI
jgi:hypothetical protein